jgi:hypothetical protein
MIHMCSGGVRCNTGVVRSKRLVSLAVHRSHTLHAETCLKTRRLCSRIAQPHTSYHWQRTLELCYVPATTVPSPAGYRLMTSAWLHVYAAAFICSC